jgi:PKD repeat protein
MKKFILLIAAITLLLTTAFAQSTTDIRVEGWVGDTATQNLIPFYKVEYVMTDTAYTTTLFQGQFATDSTGHFAHNILLGNYTGVGRLRLGVQDCNGKRQQVEFNFDRTVFYVNNWNFNICQPADGPCFTRFGAATSNGSPTVDFIDWSSCSAGTAATWEWDFGDGDSSALQNPQHTYAATGDYYVRLVVQTDLGCASAYSDTVHVGAASGGCQTNFSVTNLPLGGFDMVAASAGPSNPIAYQFTYGDGYIWNTSSDSVYYWYDDYLDTYEPCVTTYFADGCSSTACAVAINNVYGGLFPLPAAYYTTMPDTTGQFSLLISNLSLGNDLVFEWAFGDGTTSNQPYPQHTYPGTGTYQVCLTATDTVQNLSSTFCDSITVLQKLNTPFTIQVVQGNTVGTVMVQETLPLAQLYPNPAHDHITLQLELPTTSTLAVEIYNLQGQTVGAIAPQKRMEGNHQIELPIAELPRGMYLVRFAVGNATQVFKFVVE